MYEFGLYFPMKDRAKALQCLFSLPIEHRPHTLHLDENPRRKDLKFVKGLKDLDKYLANPFCIFFLVSDLGKFLVGFQDSYFALLGDYDANWSDISSLLKNMMSAKPRFGFAACSAERRARNFIQIKTDIGSESAFFGQNLDRFIPGIYWITLISDELANRHGLDLAPVAEGSVSQDQNSECRLFQMYENPADWKREEKRLNALSAPNGFFHRKDVIDDIGMETNGRVVSEKIDAWF